MAEIEFYKNGNVSITNARFMVNTTTYAMNGVTSVKRKQIEPSQQGPIIVGIVGLIMIFTSSIMATQLFGIFLIIIAVIWFRSKKTTYIVLLNSSSGETQALSSTNKNYIDEVINALNQAIIYRG